MPILKYDSSAIIEYIVANLGARPRISRNSRRGVASTTKLDSSGIPICIAGFKIRSRGIFMDRSQNRKRHKFVWPIKGSKKFAKDHPCCPWLLFKTSFNPYAKVLGSWPCRYGKSLYNLPYYCLGCRLFFLICQRTQVKFGLLKAFCRIFNFVKPYILNMKEGKCQ